MEKNISFEEYKRIQFEALKKALKAFPENEVKDYWEKNQDWVKESYDDFLNSVNKNPLSDGLIFAMSLDF